MKLPLPCVICGKELESAVPSNLDKYNQPAGGTRFSTSGHYGSTVFDPMLHYQTLEICICDICMLVYKDRIAYVTESPRVSIYEYKNWNPETEN